MMATSNRATSAALAFLLGFGQLACSNRENEDAAPAPIDSGVQSGASDMDTMRVPNRVDTAAARPDTSMATPPIAPPPAQGRDTPPAGAVQPAQPSKAAQGKGATFTKIEYEGWRQYSVNCARCHGQDVLPNPVASNLLVSARPGGPVASREKFVQVVSGGRPDRGMPAFKSLLSPEEINAIYAYVTGRAEGRLPAGRPDRPGA